jgi:hypothetical protein
MSSSNKSKSRQPRSAGNEPLQYKDNIAPSERSAKPSAVVATNMFTDGQTRKLRKKSSPNKKPPLTSRTKQTKSDIHFHGDGRKSVNTDTTAIFNERNPHLHHLNKKAAIETAEKKGPGNVNKLVKMYEQLANQSKMGGKKTRKNKKSKKSKTRSKRC